MNQETVLFRGKMKGRAFNHLETTYLGYPVLLEKVKPPQKKVKEHEDPRNPIDPTIKIEAKSFKTKLSGSKRRTLEAMI